MPASQNALLASLPAGAAAAIMPHLSTAHLTSKLVLFEKGASIARAYFPTSAVISLVVGLSSGEMIEAAMVGRDGVVGAAAALDGRVSLTRAIVQIEGSALTCDANMLAAVAFQNQGFLSTLIRYEQTLYAQAQQSTACMAAHDIQSRLCRWLLRARDLAGSDKLPFTQEFLAEMLGVTRSSVTLVALHLQQAGLIRYTRGRIEILDAAALEDCSCECYAAIRDSYRETIESSRL